MKGLSLPKPASWTQGPPLGSRRGLRSNLVSAAAFAYLAAASGSAELLIVNSDLSVRKYQLPQTAFRETVEDKTTQVDLGPRTVDKKRLAKTIRRHDPDLVYCIGTKAYMMVHEVDRNERIVLSSAINWRRLPLGPNTYGIANELPAGMQLTMFKYFLPSIRRIGVLYSKKFNREWLKQATKAASEMEVQIDGYAVGKFFNVGRGLKKLLPKVDALWLIADPGVLSNTKSVELIFAQCDAIKKPILAYNAAFARRGAVLAISPDTPTIGRQAAGLAEEILANEPIDERFQTPAGSEITINLKAVQKCGLQLNEDALDSVNDIIK